MLFDLETTRFLGERSGGDHLGLLDFGRNTFTGSLKGSCSGPVGSAPPRCVSGDSADYFRVQLPSDSIVTNVTLSLVYEELTSFSRIQNRISFVINQGSSGPYVFGLNMVRGSEFTDVASINVNQPSSLRNIMRFSGRGELYDFTGDTWDVAWVMTADVESTLAPIPLPSSSVLLLSVFAFPFIFTRKKG